MAKSQEEKGRQTRKKRIDPRLDAAEWRAPPQGTSPVHLSHRSEDEPTANGSVDYALWLDNRIVGVVVAKRLSVDSQNGLVQAEQYARGLEKSTVDFGGFRLRSCTGTCLGWASARRKGYTFAHCLY